VGGLTWPVATFVIQRHPLQCGTLQDLDVATVLGGNRRAVPLLTEGVPFSESTGSSRTLPAISDQARSKASPIAFKASGQNVAPSIVGGLGSCRRYCSHGTLARPGHPANLAIAAWWTPMVLLIARQLSPASAC